MIMFDYHELGLERIRNLIEQLPLKLLRWIAINHPNNETRKIFYESTNVSIGQESVINSGVVIYDGYEPLVRIGRRVAIANNVTIIADSNPNNSNLRTIPYIKKYLCCKEKVLIEDDVWLGAGSIIFPGITISKCSIVGAGAVVTKDVKAFSVVAGVPAKTIRYIT